MASELIMSDGSSNLYFLNPITFQKVGELSVHDGNTSVTNINELEYVNGDVYANIWLEQKIAIINPQTGTVKGWIDLTGIFQSSNIDDVLNGIAYDSATGRLFVTGQRLAKPLPNNNNTQNPNQKTHSPLFMSQRLQRPNM